MTFLPQSTLCSVDIDVTPLIDSHVPDHVSLNFTGTKILKKLNIQFDGGPAVRYKNASSINSSFASFLKLFFTNSFVFNIWRISKRNNFHMLCGFRFSPWTIQFYVANGLDTDEINPTACCICAHDMKLCSAYAASFNVQYH